MYIFKHKIWGKLRYCDGYYVAWMKQEIQALCTEYFEGCGKYTLKPTGTGTVHIHSNKQILFYIIVHDADEIVQHLKYSFDSCSSLELALLF